MTVVEIYKDSELTGTQLETITRLLTHIWPNKEKTFDEILAFVKDRMERLTGTYEESTRFVIWDGDEPVAHARIFGRDVLTQAGTIRVGALSGVCVREEHRGKGYGAMVVKQAMTLVENGTYPVSLWITGVTGFYEKLGARVVHNKWVNSQYKPDPRSDPWPDTCRMIYPADYPWPEGEIDLNGDAY